MSVKCALMIGVSICTRSSAASRLSASGWLCASSISMPTHSDSARAASVNDFWIISMRRTSGCTMIGSAGPLAFFGPVSERPWMRSRA